MEDEEALLAASRAALKHRGTAAQAQASSSEAFTRGEDVVLLEDGSAAGAEPSARRSHGERALSAKQRGKLRRVHAPNVAAPLADVEHGVVASPKKFSKRQMDEVSQEKGATNVLQHRSKTAGGQWYDMPAFSGAQFKPKTPEARAHSGRAAVTGGDARAPTATEMRRQVTAVRLRNALDPKQFYRGSGGTGAERGMPAFAQLGTVIGGGLEPSTILTRQQRSNTVVGELVNDAMSVNYSKRKFAEEHHLQAALSSHQLESSGAAHSDAKRAYHIPTPKSVEVLTASQYNQVYPTNAYSDPVTHVRFSDTVENATRGVPYCMDEDDKDWLDTHNANARKGLEEALKCPKALANRAALQELSEAGLAKQCPEKYLTMTEDELETVMYVFEQATSERHPLLELDMSKLPRLEELLPEFDQRSATSAMAYAELPPLASENGAVSTKPGNGKPGSRTSTGSKRQDAEAAWSPENPFKNLQLLKPYAQVVYPWWKLRRQAREGKPLVPLLNFDESNENDPYVCFRRREAKSARKTRKTDTLQLERLVRLEAELQQATTLATLVAQRERLKEDQIHKAQACWKQARELMDLRRQWGIPGAKSQEDDDLMFGIQPDPTAPIPTVSSPAAQLLKKKRKADEGAAAATTLKIRRPKLGDADAVMSAGKTGAAESASKGIGTAILERVQTVQAYIERECMWRQQADAGVEDLTDSAFQPPAAPPSQRAFRPIQSDNSDTRFWSNHPFARLGRQPCFRRRVGRGGRVFLDRRPLVASPAPANIGAWPRETKSGMSQATFSHGREADLRGDAGNPAATLGPSHSDALRSYAPFVYSARVKPMLLPTPDLGLDPHNAKDSRASPSSLSDTKFGREGHNKEHASSHNEDASSSSSQSSERSRASEETNDDQSTQATDVEQDTMHDDKVDVDGYGSESQEESQEEQTERVQRLAERWRYDDDAGRWAGLGLLGLGGMEGDEEAVLDDFDHRFIRYRMSLLDETNLLKLSTDWTYMRQALAAAEAHPHVEQTSQSTSLNTATSHTETAETPKTAATAATAAATPDSASQSGSSK
ncbi:Enhancer of polycomb-like protein 1 [Malassezia sp. CBS 17886]|nr:Enhancer of polycomb-like protein 1 [Malassezia sp. CBS 17886]